MIKCGIMIFSICATLSVSAASKIMTAENREDAWRVYSQEPNGDIYFYDALRVKTATDVHQVWSRIRYKTSLMGASSYQSLLEINCSENTERILQNTFFSDKNWKRPAISTDKTEKPKRPIQQDSASERLSVILCGN